MASSSPKTPKASFVAYTCFTLLTLFLIKEGNAHLDHAKTLTASIASILPSSTCKHSASTSTGPIGDSTLRVVNRNGACYNQNSGKQFLSLDEILDRDQSRVNYIQSRQKDKFTDEMIIKLPAQAGISLGSENYIVSVGLGTPRKYFNLIFDTGSDLTWTQCAPCIIECYHQNETIFDPSQSTSYSNVSCFSPTCALLKQTACSGSTCLYVSGYGDGSVTEGFLATDTLSLGTDEFPGFVFGCGEANRGLFGEVDGLLGLGQNKISLVHQTAEKYGKVFSYCLPTYTGADGYLTFGKDGISEEVKYTPITKPDKGYYYVDIMSITVGGVPLPIEVESVFKTGTIVDSGTVITRLPAEAYAALRDAFKERMTQYKEAPASGILDTCYDLTGVKYISIPTVNFVFRGNVSVNLGFDGIISVNSQTEVCLAFAGNADRNAVSIFGNVQQQTQQVVYDVAAGYVGFAAGGCS